MEPDQPSDITQQVGRRIAELRQGGGVTQEAFAERLGVSLKYVQRIEGGRQNLTLRSLARLAILLGVGPGELFLQPASVETRVGRPRRRPDPDRG